MENINPFGKYGLIAILHNMPVIEEDLISCNEQLHYYEEAKKYGDPRARDNVEALEGDIRAIKDIRCELRFYLMLYYN